MALKSDMTSRLNLQEHFGNLDIYLFDQLLKGRFTPRMRLLDAGCGAGRNLIYFLREGYEVFGVDESEEAIVHVRRLATLLAPELPQDNFRVEAVEKMTFADASFNLVISNAVLHFAFDEDHWHRMVSEMWRVLTPGGFFFARLASTIGMEDKVQRIEGRRFSLPDGSDRFLVDERMLIDATEHYGGELIEPIKTTVVQSMRSMTTWCVLKG
ncbi:MAG: class I SAM-dependent methyltransferase [Pyrinomonadaceae bacterium MAG19_C2-C3]|nr:class I SAM-dependent methyltransferase [Pyrinomonadaceae bacterium MAG19_C2-C3]